MEKEREREKKAEKKKLEVKHIRNVYTKSSSHFIQMERNGEVDKDQFTRGFHLVADERTIKRHLIESDDLNLQHKKT